MEVVTGALPRVVAKLSGLLIGEYNLQKGVKGEIRFLKAELESMQGALDEISKTQVDQLQNNEKIWARDVRELSYDIEDTVDTFMARGKVREQDKGFKKYMDRSLDLLTRFQFHRKLATGIRDIKSRVTEVCERRDRYKVDSVTAKPATTTVDPRLLAKNTKVTELIGIDEERDKLINILVEENEASMHQGKVISIVGFGGLGKTTVANAVYEKLKALFDCWAFVSVSQNPEMKKLFRNMLHQLGKNNIFTIEETMDEWQLISELQEFLRKKRCLIVVDDIWDILVWEMIRKALPDNDGVYIIITTTRKFDVAKQVGCVYKLKPLSLRNSRILLYRRVFGNGYEDKCPDEQLAKVSDKILKKCAGVPLAIITIASLLASKGRNKMEWYELYNSIGTGLENCLDVKNMRMILSLSYYDLPSHLRSCLLYLSVFPEDYYISKDRLIRLWIAEGFIQCEKQGGSLFELGENYFNELINRSLIEPVYVYDAMIECCTVHDMVLDLIRSLLSEENFVTVLSVVNHTSLSKKVRRLSLQTSKVECVMHQATTIMQHVRSLVTFPSAFHIIPAFQSFRVLRVLDLDSCDLSKGCNLKYLGYLFHMRYLRLHYTRIYQLPEEIGNLRSLQTLDVLGNKISNLPSSVVQLRDLKCLSIHKDTRVPNGIGSLTSLEQLSRLSINDSASIMEELGHLTELRVLHIYCPFKWNNSLQKSLSCKRSRVELQQEDLEILGRLPTLRYLDLEVDHENIRIARRFTIGAALFTCLVECEFSGFRGIVVFQQGAMPRLTRLEFTYPVWELRKIAGTNTDFELGLGNLTSLEDVTVYFRCGGASEGEVEEAKSAVNHAVVTHPNRPELHMF
ncbi:unnamed protein product [Urochloa decumbens]|uniref:Uncharacterized protein n=1 Tax=Urochloa decumbens TaxID=240449 RepID=A0ABC9AN63_9POAL